MQIHMNKYEPKREPPMLIQWLLLAGFLGAWTILALVFFLPQLF